MNTYQKTAIVLNAIIKKRTWARITMSLIGARSTTKKSSWTTMTQTTAKALSNFKSASMSKLRLTTQTKARVKLNTKTAEIGGRMKSPVQKVIDQGNMRELIGDILSYIDSYGGADPNSIFDGLLLKGHNPNQIIKEVQQYCMEEYFKTLSEGEG
jgi:hypothetical protein